MKRLLTSILLASALICTAWSQGTSAQKSKKARLEKEIATLERQISRNGRESADALGQLTLVRRQVSSRQALVREIEHEIKVLNGNISACEDTVNHLQGRLDTLALNYEMLVRSAYRNRNSNTWLVLLLSSSDLAQASRRFAYLKSLAGQIREASERMTEAKLQVESKLGELQVLRDSAEVVRTGYAGELAALKASQAASESLVAKLNKDRKRYEKDLASKRRQVDALAKEIQKAIEAELASKSGSGKSKKASKPIDYTLSAKFEENRGKLPWPAEGAVVGQYGRHFHPVYKNVELPFNNGVNIAVDAKSAVNVVFDGEVRKIIMMPGYNKCVLVQHGGYFTFYCKLGEVSVKAGDKVRTGQKIGTVDTIDGQTVLHFELWKGTQTRDPEDWLR